MERDICLKLLGTALLYATNVVTAHTAWLWYKNLFWHWKKGKMWCTKFKTQQNVMLLKGCHSLHNNQLVIWHDSIAWKWHLKLPVIAVQSHLTKLILSNTSKANARLDIFFVHNFWGENKAPEQKRWHQQKAHSQGYSKMPSQYPQLQKWAKELPLNHTP